MVVLSRTDAENILTIPDLLNSLLVAGDPGNDIRLMAVGLVWRNARWVVHLRGGGDANRFVDNDPWSMPSSGGPPEGSGHVDAMATTRTTASSSASGSKENLLKMANLVDQTDDSETRLPDGRDCLMH